MIAIYDNTLNSKNVAAFCDEVTDKIYLLKESDWVDVYFSTNGGENTARVPLMTLFTKYQDYIKIYLKDIMVSNGFMLLMELLENNIQIYMSKEFSYSMIHKTSCCLPIERFTGFESIMKKDVTNTNKIMFNKLKKLGLTEQQLETYNKGEDVYFSKAETLKLFPNITLIK